MAELFRIKESRVANMANRVTEAAAKYQRRIDSLNGETLTGGSMDDAEKDLDLTPHEHFAYQEAQARAHASGMLTLPEARTVYAALGEGSNWRTGTSLAMKVAITLLMLDLMAAK
jgi:hypothetical protein